MTSPSSSFALFREAFPRESILHCKDKGKEGSARVSNVERKENRGGKSKSRSNSLNIQLRNHVIDGLLAGLVVGVAETVGIPVKIVARHGFHPSEGFGLSGRGGTRGGREGSGSEVESEFFLTVVGLKIGSETVGEASVG